MVESKFKVHTFSDTLLDQTVHFQVLRMKDSLYIWIGSSPELSSLAVAMCTRYVSQRNFTPSLVPSKVLDHLIQGNWKETVLILIQDSVPSVANLLGSKADLNSSTLAQRLGKLFKSSAGIIPRWQILILQICVSVLHSLLLRTSISFFLFCQAKKILSKWNTELQICNFCEESQKRNVKNKSLFRESWSEPGVTSPWAPPPLL